MKYKDPSTGTFKELKIRATDELPVGTEVDFDGTSADIPAGWEETDDIFKEVTVTGTTDASGFVNTDLPDDTHIISCYETSLNYSFAFPFNNHTSNKTSIRVLSYDFSPFTNQSVTIKVLYKNN